MIVCRKEQVHSLPSALGIHQFLSLVTLACQRPLQFCSAQNQVCILGITAFPYQLLEEVWPLQRHLCPYRRVPLTPAPHPDGFTFTRPFPLPQPFVYFIALITVHNHITYFLLSCFQAVPLHMHTCLKLPRSQGSHLSCLLLCHQHLSQG